MSNKLLTVEDLSISFDTLRGDLKAVRHASFFVERGETLGVVGESGCGKSISNLAIMGLLPNTATVEAKTLNFNGLDLLKATEKEKRKIRGKDITMIFQDPMTSLNPSFTVGFQIMETLKIHEGGTKKELEERAVQILDEVGIPAPRSRIKSYPHELSGGMNQRVMIAQAIACNPKLLIADEPTTALDVTIQSQILDLLMKLKENHNMGLIFVTHDIGVVSNVSDRIQVMYAGEIIETGITRQVIDNPEHPYTEALFKSLPSYQEDRPHGELLYSLPGLVPDLINRPRGCQLHPRCPYVQEQCMREIPLTKINTEDEKAHKVKCHFPLKSKNTETGATV